MNFNLFNYKMKILFWHRKNKVNARGEAPIYCRITINGERGTDFTTHVFCLVNHFDAGKQTIIDDEIGNMKLQSMKHKINTIFIELENKNETITPNIIRDHLQGKRTLSLTFIQLMSEYQEHRTRLVQVGEISEGTLNKCKDTIKNMCLFLSEKSMRNIPLKMVSPKLASDFYYWLQERKKTGPEYAAKSIQIVKAMINYSILNDYMKFNVLSPIRFKRGAKKRIEYLTPEEVETLCLYNFRSERLQQVADLFIIQCYTGFAYSDLSGFKPEEHIETDKTDRQWIIKPRAKNEQEAVLPYFPEAKLIIEKYTQINIMGISLQLPKISNQKYNSYLKEIGEILGFKTKLTTHLGRKTFGTIALNDGYSIESVSKMLGHSNIKTTQAHYAVVLKKRIVGEL